MFTVICIADIILKKTIFKERSAQNIKTYWALEDYDNDPPCICVASQSNCDGGLVRKLFQKEKNKKDE